MKADVLKHIPMKWVSKIFGTAKVIGIGGHGQVCVRPLKSK